MSGFVIEQRLGNLLAALGIVEQIAGEPLMIASGRRAARSFEEQREGIGAFECRNALLVVDALAPLHPMVRRWTENALQYHGARAPDNQQAILIFAFEAEMPRKNAAIGEPGLHGKTH